MNTHNLMVGVSIKCTSDASLPGEDTIVKRELLRRAFKALWLNFFDNCMFCISATQFMWVCIKAKSISLDIMYIE